MVADGIVYHINPSADLRRWALTIVNNAGFHVEYATKEEVLTAAEELAQKQAPSRVRLYKRDGTIEYDRTYTGEIGT